MAGSKSDYLEAAILNYVLGGTSFTPPANIYIALSTSAYNDAATGSSMNEVSGGGTGYARCAKANDGTTWSNAVGGASTTKTNNIQFPFSAATSSWGTVQSFYICDAASGGNVLYGADLTTARTIASGDTASFAASSITITEG